jgi:preprotein translocase subunit SecE
MARQTRQQRRDRRAQQQPAPALAGGPPAPPRPRPTASAGGEPHREPRRETGGGFGLFRFINESWAELKKVEWPSQRQVITGTTVVLIACAVVGTYLYLNDIVWKHVVQNFLIK